MEQQNEDSTKGSERGTGSTIAAQALSRKNFIILSALGIMLLVIATSLLSFARNDASVKVAKSESDPLLSAFADEQEIDEDEHGPELVAEVAVMSDGFSPQSMYIEPGTRVTWVNKTRNPVKIMADPYPTGKSLPELRTEQPLGPEQTYSYVFATAGIYTYHEATNATNGGTIFVSEFGETDTD